jgi:hypothetical protein
MRARRDERRSSFAREWLVQVGKYAKGRASEYRPMRQGEKPICRTCRSSGVIKQRDGTLLLCPYGCRVGQHSVQKALREQDELEVRMAAVKAGKW